MDELIDLRDKFRVRLLDNGSREERDVKPHQLPAPLYTDRTLSAGRLYAQRFSLADGFEIILWAPGGVSVHSDDLDEVIARLRALAEEE